MAEPSRKINKGQRSTLMTPIAPAVSELGKRGVDDDDPLVFWSLNLEDPYLVNLTEFATGRTAKDVTIGKHRWTGDFRGRPSLIAELLPTIKHLYGLYRAASFEAFLDRLRFWWRVFEDAETQAIVRGYILKPVESIADLQILHHQIAIKRGVNTHCHFAFTRLVNFARAQKKLPLLHWPNIENESRPSKAPETWEVERIRHALKHQWFGALKHWKTTDTTKPDLWGWKRTHYLERSIHAHEVYRAVIELTGHSLPSPVMVQQAIGFRNDISWMRPYLTPIAGLYPTAEEIRAAFMLCLIYSGWNISTLLNLKIDGRFVEDHPTNPEYHVVYGFKERGKSEHQCIGRNKRSDAPGTILRKLVERTQPLRKIARKELAEITTRIAEGAASTRELNELIKQRNNLMERLRSPWLYVGSSKFAVMHLTKKEVNRTKRGSFMENLIHTINLNQPANKQIRDSIVPSDLRDSYVGFAYEFSNFSILTAQLAAGHKQASTTQGYLRHRQWKAHSVKMIHKFQVAMFREIDENKSIDPTILRANMEWEKVTNEERARLAEYRKNRTRLGVACKDPTKPPPSIAPNHTKGGCRVQRCTLCHENAILLSDSYDGIAMRVAELEFLRDNIPVKSWFTSGFTKELENSEAALKLYEPLLVEARLTHWRLEIKIGRHKPML